MLGVCEALASRVPVVPMVYTNVVLSAGAERFGPRAAAAGASGLIVPDLPHDEAAMRRRLGLEDWLVPLVAPTSTPERIADIGADARGFVYTVSPTGTTGERAELAPGLADTVGRVRAATHVPVAVGFGHLHPPARPNRGGDRRRRDRKVAVRAGAEGRPGGGGALVAELSAALAG